MKKYQSTGFARFFIFLILFAPLAFIGASYYNGEDGLQKFKDFFASDKEVIQIDEKSDNKSDLEKLEKENEDLKKRIEELEETQ